MNQTLPGISALMQRDSEWGLVAEPLMLGFGGTRGLPGPSVPEEGLVVPIFPGFHEILSILPVNFHFYLGSLQLVSVICKQKKSTLEETSVQLKLVAGRMMVLLKEVVGCGDES